MKSARPLAVLALAVSVSFMLSGRLYCADAQPDDKSAQKEAVPPQAPLTDDEVFGPQGRVTQPDLPKIDLPSVERAQEIYVLKRIDPDRIGAQTYYETFGGVRVPEKILRSPSIGVGQRVEIYQEPKPVDAYIIMAKEMLHEEGLSTNGLQRRWYRGQNMTPAHYRSIILPLFVRAYGTEFTASDPNESKSDEKGQVKYTIDYRDVYREYVPKFPDLKVSRWLQNDIVLIHAKKLEPLGWMYWSNLGYRFSNIEYKEIDDAFAFNSGDEMRSTYYYNMALAPDPGFELFGQFEYFKSRHVYCAWPNQPDHVLYAGEIRVKSPDLKTSYTFRMSYSNDTYLPSNNIYEKYEVWVRMGRDFNDRFSAYTMLKYVYGHTAEDDNDVSLPAWPTPAPYDVCAAALTWETRAQYRIYDRLWIQGGFDLGTGLNMSDFDNVGWLAGLEYYAPGIIRVDFGWRGNQYYNVDDFLTTFYFKVFFFM